MYAIECRAYLKAFANGKRCMVFIYVYCDMDFPTKTYDFLFKMHTLNKQCSWYSTWFSKRLLREKSFEDGIFFHSPQIGDDIANQLSVFIAQ